MGGGVGGRIEPMAPKQTEPLEEGEVDHPCVEWSEGVARYLIAISDLSKAETKPTQAELARVLEVSQPSVLEMVRKLRGMGLVEEEGLALTSEEGVLDPVARTQFEEVARVRQAKLDLAETLSSNRPGFE